MNKNVLIIIVAFGIWACSAFSAYAGAAHPNIVNDLDIIAAIKEQVQNFSRFFVHEPEFVAASESVSFWCAVKIFIGFDCSNDAGHVTEENSFQKQYAAAAFPAQNTAVSSPGTAIPAETSSSFLEQSPNENSGLSFDSVVASLKSLFQPKINSLEQRLRRMEQTPTVVSDTSARNWILALQKEVDGIKRATYFSPSLSYTPDAMLGWDGKPVIFGVSAPSGIFSGDISAQTGTFSSTVTGGNFATAGTLTVGGASILSGALSAGGTLYIDAVNGRVGIGSSTPTDTLSLNGPLFLSSTTPGNTASRLYNTGGSLYWAGSLVGGATTGNWTTDGTHAWRATGNVGIGTTSPYAKLSVSNSATTPANTPLFTIASTTGGTATSTLLTVLANGNVGIGTANPIRKLTIQGTNGNYDGILIKGDDSSIKFTDALETVQRSVIGYNVVDTSGYLGPTNSTFVYGGPGNLVLNTDGGVLHPILLQVNPTGGNVGIGTTTPSSRLTSYLAAGGTVGAASESSLALASGGALNSNSQITFGKQVTGSYAPAYMNFVTSDATAFSKGYLSFGTRNVTTDTQPTEAMRIDTTGNVGIGTAAPAQLLHVEGNLSGGNGINALIRNTNANGSAGLFVQNNGTLIGGFSAFGTSFSVPSLMDTAGPFSTAGVSVLSNSNISGGGTKSIKFIAGGYNNSPTMTITAGNPGNVGIGTTTPQSALSVSSATGEIRSQATSAGSGWMSFWTSANVRSGYFQPDAGAGYGILDFTGTGKLNLSGGNVGIATSSPWRTLSVNGTVAMSGLTASSTGNALCIMTSKEVSDAGGGTCTPSSIRFKENVETLASGFALDELKKLTVVSFDYKDGAFSPEDLKGAYGMIAEDVEKVDPKLVDYGYDGKPLTLKFEKFIGLLVQAVQELSEQVNSFAHSFTTKRLETHELCIDDVCVTKTELQTLLDNAHTAGFNSSIVSAPTAAVSSPTMETVPVDEVPAPPPVVADEPPAH